MACVPDCNSPDPRPALCFRWVHFRVLVYFRASAINSEAWNTGSYGHACMCASMFGIYVWGSHLPLNGGSKILPNFVTFLTKLHTIILLKVIKGKAIPLQAYTGPEGSRRLRLPDFKTLGTWRWFVCHSYAPAAFTPRKYSWYSFLLEAKLRQEGYVNEKFQWDHRELNLQPCGL